MTMANSHRASHHTAFLRNALAVATLGFALTHSAQAQDAQPDTVWRCWYNQDSRIQCVLVSATPGTPADPRYADNPKLPQAIKQLWTNAASAAGSRVFIPLFTEPEDWDRVRLLAESVMCGANRSCVVDFSRSYIEAAMLDPDLQP
jgi:hypothetical protein